MPSLKCWDSECQLRVSLQSQDAIRSPETYSGHCKDTHWVSYLQHMSVRYPLPFGVATQFLLSCTTCHADNLL